MFKFNLFANIFMRPGVARIATPILEKRGLFTFLKFAVLSHFSVSSAYMLANDVGYSNLFCSSVAFYIYSDPYLARDWNNILIPLDLCSANVSNSLKSKLLSL